MKSILPDYLQEYLNQLLPERDPVLARMEAEAREHFIPIVEPEVGRLLFFFTRLIKAKRVLELGMSIGYSTIWLARGVQPEQGQVLTIEINPAVLPQAEANLAAAGVRETVEIRQGDALAIVPQLAGEFDLIFIDAGKGHYQDYVDCCLPLLRTGGVLISDNVLVRGLTTGQFWVKRRNRTIIKRMRNYLNYLTAHPQLETIVLPLADGVTVSFKREGGAA